MLKIHLVVGARPNFMKIAPLFMEISRFPEIFSPLLVHTGQHYDPCLSRLFLEELHLPQPDIHLEVGSGSHGEQTGKIMERYEEFLLRDKPDLVIVAGDVNSTLACAIDAVKLHIPVAHLEAGLRSFDRTMPEELNRIMTDAIADFLFTPSPDADQNLLKEGISPDKIYFVGNIMIDSLQRYLPEAERSGILAELQINPAQYGLITLHRPHNVDEPSAQIEILEACRRIAGNCRLIFPVHPRSRRNLIESGLLSQFEAIPQLQLLEPLGYYDFLKLQKEAAFVLTDSGGVQEETTFLGVPCLTLRPNTERPVTVEMGTNSLIPLQAEFIFEKVQEILKGNIKTGRIPELWDGHTALRISKILLDKFS